MLEDQDVGAGANVRERLAAVGLRGVGTPVGHVAGVRPFALEVIELDDDVGERPAGRIADGAGDGSCALGSGTGRGAAVVDLSTRGEGSKGGEDKNQKEPVRPAKPGATESRSLHLSTFRRAVVNPEYVTRDSIYMPASELSTS